MATIKNFTSLEQSRKLAEILPLKSADMCYVRAHFDRPKSQSWFLQLGKPIKSDDVVGAWSLAALLGALPYGIVMNKDSQNGRYHFASTYIGTYVTADNPIDACYEMILKLNELNLL